MFWGMYRSDDLSAVIKHSGLAVIRWSGHDAATFTDWDLIRFKNIHHITPFKNVARILSIRGFHCHLIPSAALNAKPNPLIMGNRVYAYCPSSAKHYHGFKMIGKLSKEFSMMIGDGAVPQYAWGKVCDRIYSQCFIGLVLNNHAGGGATIKELGLRGIRVITNVSDLPHTIPWNTIDDVSTIIYDEMCMIGEKNVDLASAVYQSLDKQYEYLNTEYYG